MTQCADENCVHDHIRPWLSEPRITSGGSGYLALAPCHADTSRSLSVSYEHRRILWCCHACQDRLGKEMAQIRTRSALIAAGVPARCLPPTREQVESTIDQFRDVLHSDLSHVEKVIRLAVITECGGEMPAGSELDRLAGWCGASRRAAYRARGASSDNL